VAYDDDLTGRDRAVHPRGEAVTERQMFGGLAFMLGGHMFCGVVKDTLMVRLGPEAAGPAGAICLLPCHRTAGTSPPSGSAMNSRATVILGRGSQALAGIVSAAAVARMVMPALTALVAGSKDSRPSPRR
jgi:hypothetical protein